MSADAIDVRDDPAGHRYVITVGADQAGFARYRLVDDRIVFTHTEIDERFEGQGLGGRLARAALDDVRGRGLAVTAQCPFIARWIDRHPDYQDLLAG